MNSGFGFVKYVDKAIVFKFLTKSADDPDILYFKRKKWEVENEFRFITVGVGRYSTRIQTFKPDTVAELILGYNILPAHEQEIMKIVNEKYSLGLKVFKTKRNANNTLGKEQIK